jgi:hypothetical protein
MTSAADFSVHSQDLLDFVDASPSPSACYSNAGGASLIDLMLGQAPLA